MYYILAEKDVSEVKSHTSKNAALMISYQWFAHNKPLKPIIVIFMFGYHSKMSNLLPPNELPEPMTTYKLCLSFCSHSFTFAGGQRSNM